jgi:UDP-2,4-diacetamido-2,4,6-trideoxy-beta-L-altropyranose hydrolase
MRLVFRADASAQMGTGHLMRCLALAQAWRGDGGESAFVTRAEGPLAERLKEEGNEVVAVGAAPGSSGDATRTAEVARREGADWIVLDGYHLLDPYELALRERGARIVAFDDYGHARHEHADLVVNANAYAAEDEYRRRGTTCELMLGGRYVPLRREFERFRSWEREQRDRATRVLVALGGSDPENRTREVLGALVDLGEGVEAIVVAGASNVHRASLEKDVRELPIRVDLRSDVREVSELMAWADLGVGAGGTSSWERAFMELPSAVVVLADNQERVAESVEALGLGVRVGRGADLRRAVAAALRGLAADPRARREMGRRGREQVDGEGCDRLVQRLRGDALRLREVRAADRELLFEWANEEGARRASIATDPIPWDRHVEWFAERLRDPHCHFFLGLDAADVPIGVVRFDAEGEGAEISVSLAKPWRGRGLGTALIRAATQRVFSRTGVRSVDAFIEPDTTSSLAAFAAAGFAPAGERRLRGARLLRYRKAKGP